MIVVGPSHARRYVSAVDESFFGKAGVRALVHDKKALPTAKDTQGGSKAHKKHFKAGRKEKIRRRKEGTNDTQTGFTMM